MIRCKMICIEKADHFDAYNKTKRSIVKFQAMTDPANKTWAKYTPSGSIELGIDNPEAVDAFQLGQSYFVDFREGPATEAEEKPQASA